MALRLRNDTPHKTRPSALTSLVRGIEKPAGEEEEWY
jgi:hypothetical protein